MYLIMHVGFSVGCIDVYYLPEDDQDRSKHVGVVTNCLQNIILTLVLLLLFSCEVTVHFFP